VDLNYAIRSGGKLVNMVPINHTPFKLGKNQNLKMTMENDFLIFWLDNVEIVSCKIPIQDWQV